MAPRRKNRLSQTELARMARVSTKTLRDWRDKEGLNLDDIEAVMTRAGKVDRLDDSTHGESYTEARRRREVALANRAEIIAAREAGTVADLAEITRAFQQVGLELRARLMALRGDLVLQLHGLDEAGIFRVLDQSFRELLSAIATEAPIPQSKNTP